MADPSPARGAKPGAAAAGERRGARWYEVVLAAVLAALLVAAVVAAAWWSRGAGDWRGETAGDVFLAAMLAVAAVAAIAFLVYLIVRAARRPGRRRGREHEGDAVESPAGVRLLGLALLAVLFLVTAWVHAPPALAHGLVANLLYPAAFALALVLLFDKASRAWAVKGAGVSFREWLHCDAITILLVLGYFNLESNAVPEEYSALFWDALHVVLFVFVFWLLDRKFTRLRWLVGLAYLTLLPVLLWIWRLTLDIAAPEDLSWWSTPWPFIALGLIACAVEIIALAATGRGEDDRGDGTAGHIVKDALFFVLYGGLLIAAAR
ncbi:MAG: hypothetical protein OXC01_16120 [Immundisolibacterales bacterium]|nr:hypothetical protein [Immundisolibacterales bacterium]